MSYNNHAECKCEAGTIPAMPEPTMADIMKEISIMAEQNKQLSCRIRVFLTGCSEDQSERAKEPICFREELLRARYETRCTNELLGFLAVELGLP